MAILLKYLHIIAENIEYLGFLALLFLAVTMFIGSTIFLLQRRSGLAERLAAMMPHKRSAADQQKAQKLFPDEPRGFIDKLSRKLHPITTPSNLNEAKRLRLMLIQAGFRTDQAYHKFLAAKIVLAILLPLGYLLRSAFYKFSLKSLGIAVFLAIVGHTLPNLVVLYLQNERQQKLRRALPDALDMMVVCVTAGLGLDMTLKRVAEETHQMNKELSEEFLLTNLEIRAGRPRDESYKDLTRRTGVAELHNLMTVLLQTSRFGTSVAEALRIHADAMRIKRRQIAEEKAAKSAVKLLIPLILFIFPALLIVLVGPAGIRVARTLFPILAGGG